VAIAATGTAFRTPAAFAPDGGKWTITGCPRQQQARGNWFLAGVYAVTLAQTITGPSIFHILLD